MAAARLPVLGTAGAEVPVPPFPSSPGDCRVKCVPYRCGGQCSCVGSRRVCGGCLLTPGVPLAVQDTLVVCIAPFLHGLAHLSLLLLEESGGVVQGHLGIGEPPINTTPPADDRPKPVLVVSKPISLEPSKSASPSPSPPPPLIPEVEPVVLSAMTLVPMEPPMDADTKVELGEAPPDPHKTFSAITTVPGAMELPLVPAPDMDTVAVEEEEVTIPLPEPAPQAPAPPEVPSVPVVPSMPAVPPVPAVPSPPPVVPQAPEAPAKPASPSPTPAQEEPCPEPAVEPPAEANGVLEEAPEPIPEMPVCQLLPALVPASTPVPAPTLDSPIAQPEELPLPNGVEGTGKAEPSEEQPESDVSPISEPEEAAQPSTPVSPPAEEEEEESEGASEAQERSSSPAPAPLQTSEATTQGWECWAGHVGCPRVRLGWCGEVTWMGYGGYRGVP